MQSVGRIAVELGVPLVLLNNGLPFLYLIGKIDKRALLPECLGLIEEFLKIQDRLGARPIIFTVDRLFDVINGI